jgi:hypothetical protein
MITTATTPTGPAGSAASIAGRALRGRALRFLLVDELMNRAEMTVAEMAATVAAQGYRLPGRASKTISDALRWEVRRGRVARLGRGRYRYATAPASTARRIRIFANRCRAWIADLTRGDRPIPFPPDPRPGPYWQAYHDPSWPPWAELRWLWVL